MDKTDYKKRIESEQIIERITNKDLLCGKCRYKYDDSKIFSNITSCEKYKNNTKPDNILAGGTFCEYYKEEN